MRRLVLVWGLLCGLSAASCVPRGLPFPPGVDAGVDAGPTPGGDGGPDAAADGGPGNADGNAYTCEVACVLDRIFLGDVTYLRAELDSILSLTFLPDPPPSCLSGFSEVCFSEPDSALRAADRCASVSLQIQDMMNSPNALVPDSTNEVRVARFECNALCVDVITGLTIDDENLFLRNDVGGTGVAQECWALEHGNDGLGTPTDLELECDARFAVWLSLPGHESCSNTLSTSEVVGASTTCDISLPEPFNWDCTGTPTSVDLFPAASLDCVVADEGFAVACASPSRNTDRIFTLDPASSFINVYQPDEIAPGGAVCSRSLVGSTSLSGDIWLDGGFCPGTMCPVTVGDFDWATTAPLALGAICGGMSLGSVPLARLNAVDTLPLTAEPLGPASNEVPVPAGAFMAAISFAVGSEVQGLQIENAVAESALLDSATNRVIIDLSFLQDLFVTTREFEVHLEGTLSNTRPVANAGADRSIGCGDSATLSSASTDADGVADIVSFFWTEIDPVTGARAFIGRGPSITVHPVVTTEYVLTITDASGATDEDSVLVTLPPFAPVSIDAIVAVPECLWPPNHKYAPFELGTDLVVTTSGGLCGATGPQVRIANVVSNEPDDGAGDGSTSNDVVFGLSGLCVRSERSGPGEGRVYTVTVEARDAADNTAVGSVPIVVPHDLEGEVDCSRAPTFVDDDDARCAFGRVPAVVRTRSCVASVAGADAAPAEIVTVAVLLLGVFLMLTLRRRRQ